MAMMQWKKKGLIYCPTGKNGWDNNSFMTPTPFLLNKDQIRIYGGIRDEDGRSRISYIDVDANDPSTIIYINNTPVIELGKPGTFDDNGMILGSLLETDGEIKMYYVGFQLVNNVKFLAFSGLAISKDGGNSFTRNSDSPVMDRYKNEIYIRAIHTVLYENNRYKIWYSTGSGWQTIHEKVYPQYYIRYTESADGINIFNDSKESINVINDEYRIGRPTVFKHNSLYKMFYTRDTLSKQYSPGYAESADGITWIRKDEEMKLERSSSGWDSEMVCYPAPLFFKNKCYVFYNGNNMGMSGFGYAELVFN